MRFFPPTAEPQPIALTSGHTIVVEPGGTELEPRFHREAIALGCRPDGAAPEETMMLAAFDPRAVIRTVIEDMLDSAAEHVFTQEGKPSLKVLKERCGFNVSREECDAAWAEIQQSAR